MVRVEFTRIARAALLEATLAEQDFVLDIVQSALLDDELNLFVDRGPVLPMDHAEQVVAPLANGPRGVCANSPRRVA